MSNTARKARKRAGIPFTRTPKVGTPMLERQISEIFDLGRSVLGFRTSHRARNRIARRLAALAPNYSLANERRANRGQS